MGARHSRTRRTASTRTQPNSNGSVDGQSSSPVVVSRSTTEENCTLPSSPARASESSRSVHVTVAPRVRLTSELPPPHSFLGPITKDIMERPVILEDDGFSYEEEAILQWFQQQRRNSNGELRFGQRRRVSASGVRYTSPMTGQTLNSTRLIPNHALRAAIAEYRERVAEQEQKLAVEQMIEEHRTQNAVVDPVPEVPVLPRDASAENGPQDMVTDDNESAGQHVDDDRTDDDTLSSVLNSHIERGLNLSQDDDSLVQAPSETGTARAVSEDSENEDHDQATADTLYHRAQDLEHQHEHRPHSHPVPHDILAEIEICYERCLTRDPNHRPALSAYARFLERVRREMDRAEVCWRRLLALEPDCPVTLNNYANFLYRTGRDHDKAERLYLQLLQSFTTVPQPDDVIVDHRFKPRYLVNYANFLRVVRRDYRRAASYYEWALTLNSCYIRALCGFAALLSRRRRDQEVQHFDVDEESNRLRKAEVLYKRALDVDASHCESLWEFAKFLKSQKRYQEAISILRRLRRVHQNQELVGRCHCGRKDTSILYELAHLLLKNHSRFGVCIRSKSNKHHRHRLTHHNRSLSSRTWSARESNKELEEAERILRIVLHHEPTHQAAQSNLDYCLRHQRHPRA